MLEQTGLFGLLVGGVVAEYSSVESYRGDSTVVVRFVLRYSGDQLVCQETAILGRFEV